jgi:tellurite resistance protein
MDAVSEIEIDEHQAEAIARGLYAVAVVDGAHERELALIAEFYAGTGGPKSFATLERLGPLEPKALAAQLEHPAHRRVFLQGALLVAYADGTVSDAERASVNQFASALAVDAATLAQIESEVKDQLLRPLAGLANSEAVSQVAKKLKL